MECNKLAHASTSESSGPSQDFLREHASGNRHAITPNSSDPFLSKLYHVAGNVLYWRPHLRVSACDLTAWACAGYTIPHRCGRVADVLPTH